MHSKSVACQQLDMLPELIDHILIIALKQVAAAGLSNQPQTSGGE